MKKASLIFIMSSIFNQIAYQFPTKFVKIKNYDIAYIDEGNLENVLIFIHGLGSYLRAWERNIPELKKYFRCIALDLPGYGKSSKIIHSGEVSFYTEVINEFIAALGLKNISLVGHSMGGQIALSYALDYKEQIYKLILVAPAGFETFNDKDIELFRKLVSPEILFKTSDRQVKLNYEMNFCKMPVEAESMIEDRIKIKEDHEFFNHCTIVSNSLFGLLNVPVFKRLNEINIPTLIFFGQEDLLIPNKALHPVSPKEIAESGRDQIKNSKLIMLEECGHFLQYEKPTEFNSGLIKFFQ